jgi:hypothetical protein
LGSRCPSVFQYNYCTDIGLSTYGTLVEPIHDNQTYSLIIDFADYVEIYNNTTEVIGPWESDSYVHDNIVGQFIQITGGESTIENNLVLGRIYAFEIQGIIRRNVIHGYIRTMDSQVTIDKNLIVTEGEFNQLQLQSLCVIYGKMTNQEMGYLFACAVGGVNNVDYETILTIAGIRLLCPIFSCKLVSGGIG